jgi:hypothetical protein
MENPVEQGKWPEAPLVLHEVAVWGGNRREVERGRRMYVRDGREKYLP